jgi:acetyl-CoA carboxylase, biotin carboxylase subunit
MFNKILVANRGEIAVRVMRACREMGISPVAVYSDVDRAALHVRQSDEAYHIGPAIASESYLNIAKLIEVARKSGAEAVHPGYGFLSEDPAFARACCEAGIKFIGPKPETMELLASKTRARQTMQKVGVPFVPGTTEGVDSLEDAQELAAKIGYPVMLKAAWGGGGKGMRVVRSPQELASALEQGRSEAMRSFKHDEVYIEKLIENPRHIEVQILGDEYGNLVFLGERECSVQRRHQKVLEESPSSFVDQEMRQRMGMTAIRVGKAAGYTNAGTVEFLVDERGNFYFLEVNARLQVEHPVTEFVTGLDLVHLQLRIAAGEMLPVGQDGVTLRGHAIECRIYAEDPDDNYFPSPGTITRLLEPSGPGIRRDGGVYEGWTVPIDYDPLLAKVTGYAPTRREAIARLDRAMYEYFVGGIKTNISLFRRILRDPDFVAGNINTGYLDRLLERSQNEQRQLRDGNRKIAALAAALFTQMEDSAAAPAQGARSTVGVSPNGTAASNWKRAARRDALRSD